MKAFTSWATRKNSNGSIRLSSMFAALTLTLAAVLVHSAFAQEVDSWIQADVGPTTVAGMDTYDQSTDTYNSKGAGLGVADSQDSHHFFYQKVNGDAEIVARVLNIEQVTPGSLAGLAFRSGLTSTSTVAAVTISADQKTFFRFRTPTNQVSQAVLSPVSTNLPVWVRLVRKGNTFLGYTSTNGLAWIQIAKQSIAAPSNTVAGIIVASGDAKQLALANIDQLSLRIGHPADTTKPSTPTGLGAVLSSDTSITLRWNPSSDDVGVSGYRIYRDGKYLASTGATSFTDTGLEANTAKSYTIKAYDGSGKLSSASQSFLASTKPSTLLAPWGHRDFGLVGFAGSATQNGDDFVVQGSGGDLGAVPDNFHFVYKQVSGNFEWIGKVSDIQNGVPSSKAGIMIREQLSDHSANAALFLSQDKQIYFYSRLFSTLNRTKRVKTGTTTQTFSWFKLRRVGNEVKVYTSKNGTSWSLVGEESIPMTYSVYVGMGVTSVDNSKLCTATFTGLSFKNIEDTEQSSTPPSSATVTGTEIVGSIDITKIADSLGVWEPYEDGIKARDGRGSIEYDFQLPKNGIYQLTIKGYSWGSTTDTIFPLDLSIDSQFLDRVHLFSIHGASSTVSCYTPWLKSGAHRLKIFWDGTQPRPLLVLQGVVIQKPLGADDDQNGVIDWVDERLKSLNGFDAASIESTTSPACIEGTVRFLSMMKLSDSVVAEAGPGSRWFANVPLTKGVLKTVTATFENGGLISTSKISWKETNILTAPATLLVRKGDSLLLTAYQTGMAAGAVKISISDGTELTTQSDQPIEHEFKSPGEFTLTGTYADTSPRTITIKVVESSFGNSPTAWLGRARTWDVPGLAPESVVQADSRMKFSYVKNLSPTGKQYSLMVDAAEPRVVLARLGAKGPVLAAATINGIAVYSAQQTSVQNVGSLPDGSEIIAMSIVETGPLNDISLVLSIFAAGVTFEDGSITKTLTAADFDALGRAKVRFIYPVGGPAHAICHHMKAYQGSHSIGSR